MCSVLIIFVLIRGISSASQKGLHSIASNDPECAAIGMDILENHNGSAVDAAIATLFCEGVTVCQNMGLGGGFVAAIYDKKTGSVDSLIARERAPLASHKMMFESVTVIEGMLASAVPGELKGYEELHNKYGRVAWKRLIQPTIELCRSGHFVTDYLARVLKRKENSIKQSPSLAEVFINPETQQVWVAGDRIYREKLAETLEIIANEGAQTMYTRNGKIARLLVEDIEEYGGIITIEDFEKYEVEWAKPVTTQLRGGYTLNSAPLPASGLILSMILNILNGYVPSLNVEYMHRMIESFKFSYARRTHLGDIKYNDSFINEFSDQNFAEHIRSLILDNTTFNDYKHYGGEFALQEEHGTAHISVLSDDGDAISLTSTINNIFGNGIHSRRTGIIFNDEMDDFAAPNIVNMFGIPPSPANFIEPGKRPLSSMSPIILLNQTNDVVFVCGSAGGSKITTTVANIIFRHIWLNESLEAAVKAKRFHHQLLPMEVVYEIDFDANILDGMQKLGHKTTQDDFVAGYSAVTAVSRAHGHLEAVIDPRRLGNVKIN